MRRAFVCAGGSCEFAGGLDAVVPVPGPVRVFLPVVPRRVGVRRRPGVVFGAVAVGCSAFGISVAVLPVVSGGGIVSEVAGDGVSSGVGDASA